MNVSRAKDPEEFLRVLTSFNKQRVKTLAEQIREEVVSESEDNAYAHLTEWRERNSSMLEFSAAPVIKMGRQLARHPISDAKRPMLNAVLKVIENLKKYLPLSDRQIHYQLLNLSPLRHASKPKSHYKNDRQSYNDLTDLLTRARLAGEIGWNVIADPTRTFDQVASFAEFGSFVRTKADGLFRGYWRDLMQSQPCHVEIIAEKLTVRSIVWGVASEYRIPVTIARGYSSIQPRRALADRFEARGRDRLVLLMLTDFDPDGESIAESFVRSLRDDFDIPGDRITPVKVSLGKEQVDKYRLPPSMEAKTTSSQWKAFVAKHGKHAYELEALPPDDLAKELRRAINGVIDQKMFDHERRQEAADAREVEGLRKFVSKSLREYGLDPEAA